VKLTQQWLLDAQYADGSWVGELEGDTILESEYAMMLFFMHQRVCDKMLLLAEHLRRKQLPNGGWNMYPGGAADLSGSVKAYFVLKLVGDAPDAPHMVRARQTILELGGVTACNSFTKFYLCMFGQYDWSATPAIPPEIILLPQSAYFNIYAISSWSRAMVITMAIIWHFKPVVKVPAAASIDDLYVGGRNLRKMQMRFDTNPICWRNFFLTIDKGLKLLEANNARPLRTEALKRCKAWMIEHFEGSGGVGAIFPPMINSVMSLRCFGYKDDHPLMKQAWAEVESLEIYENGTLRMQPCFSPVWDTSLAMVCLAGTGMSTTHPAMQKAARWLLDHEVRRRGDLHRYRPNFPIGGWYFEYANEYYPDADDTAMVLMALDGVRLPGEEDSRRQAAIQRGVKWALAMQSKNGGWAAFDVDNDREIFTYIPFADHNAMLDPPTADITARALEAFARFGYGVKDAAVARAIDFLKLEQEHDGCWYGRWGVNYIYGTWQVLRGLEAIGANMHEPWIQAGAAWLRAHQNADGGWGETCDSYEDPSLRGQGPSTASQTAWALMGLMSAGDYESNEVINGLCYLISHQKADGSWDEELFTGTGFPRVFYLKYHYYRIYFPMYALGMYMRGVQRRRRGGSHEHDGSVRVRADAPRLVVIPGKAGSNR
jgi:squalene-hopene/tetraprenyl-beta-curcumene cyclase